jgi:hypothetical protein
MFAKYYFNYPMHVTLPQSSGASCLGIFSLGAHSYFSGVKEMHHQWRQSQTTADYVPVF